MMSIKEAYDRLRTLLIPPLSWSGKLPTLVTTCNTLLISTCFIFETMPARLEGYVPFMAVRLPEPPLEADNPLVDMRPTLERSEGEITRERLGGSQTWEYEGEDVTDLTRTRFGEGTWELSNLPSVSTKGIQRHGKPILTLARDHPRAQTLYQSLHPAKVTHLRSLTLIWDWIRSILLPLQIKHRLPRVRWPRVPSYQTTSNQSMRYLQVAVLCAIKHGRKCEHLFCDGVLRVGKPTGAPTRRIYCKQV